MPNVSYVNSTDGSAYQEFMKMFLLSFSTVPSCAFLIINSIMLFTLRSKPVFRENCRFILLFNLLLADTVQLAQSQLAYLMTMYKVELAYTLCVVLNMLAHLTAGISPLTLVLMPLERYVAVCYPLRHATIITVRNTRTAVFGVWAVTSLNNLIRVLMAMEYHFEALGYMVVCSNISFSHSILTVDYDRAYTCIIFLSAGGAVIFSYVGVILAARSASTDKALAQKARYTLLLHLVQLGLSLSSTIYIPMNLALSLILTKLTFAWVRNVFYVVFMIFPRCMTSLVYGLRDQTIRPVLLYHLSCRMKVKVKG